VLRELEVLRDQLGQEDAVDAIQFLLLLRQQHHVQLAAVLVPGVLPGGLDALAEGGDALNLHELIEHLEPVNG